MNCLYAIGYPPHPGWGTVRRLLDHTKEKHAMTDTTEVASTEHPKSRLNQALAWVGIVAGGLFIVAGIFLSGFFLSWSEHMHMGMGHPAAMAKESKDCCADMK